MTNNKTAVLLMAYGTPRSTEEILPYYTDIRRGRVPTPEQLADLTARYDAIGGISPLAARTEAQRDALQRALDTEATWPEACAPDDRRVGERFGAAGLHHHHRFGACTSLFVVLHWPIRWSRNRSRIAARHHRDRNRLLGNRASIHSFYC